MFLSKRHIALQSIAGVGLHFQVRWEGKILFRLSVGLIEEVLRYFAIVNGDTANLF